ncbi:MAG: nucleotide sugar dehydrogenase [Candidatus Omnitrophica bacterium]|nr:nucleotide sugar dehydrogenase [Candidatus Omnitrophota bacterium]
MKLAVVGTGYVGLVTGTCFADIGNDVICVDNDEAKIAKLERAEVPIYEPGLEEMVKRNKQNGRLAFTTSIADAVRTADIIFVCVGTPPREDGSADLSGIESVSRAVAESMDSYKLIVEKSTVPVQTGQWVKKTIENFRKNEVDFDVASNPEFLREGSALEDFMEPDRVVIGVESEKAEKILRALYEPLTSNIICTNIQSAEIIKHASNSFLATKISFINAVSNICERSGADVRSVAEGMGFDTRINRYFLDAGIGFGGSCFPKDLKAFIHISEKLGYSFDLLKEVQKINEKQKEMLLEKVSEMLWNLGGKTIAVWGLAFKPDTDDIREAPAIDIIERLLGEGARIKAFDPEATENAKKELGDRIEYCGNAYETAEGADCVILMTEWNDFKEVDWDKIKSLMNQPAVIDGRNIYKPAKLRDLGFRYMGIGRK